MMAKGRGRWATKKELEKVLKTCKGALTSKSNQLIKGGKPSAMSAA